MNAEFDAKAERKKARLERAKEKARIRREEDKKAQIKFENEVRMEYGDLTKRPPGFIRLECMHCNEIPRKNSKKCKRELFDIAMDIGLKNGMAKVFLMKSGKPRRFENEPDIYVSEGDRDELLSLASDVIEKRREEERLRFEEDDRRYWSIPENRERWTVRKPLKLNQPLGVFQVAFLEFLIQHDGERSITQLSNFASDYYHAYSGKNMNGLKCLSRAKRTGMSLWRRALVEPVGVTDERLYPEGFRITELGEKTARLAREERDHD